MKSTMTTQQHPALHAAPKTLRESLERALAFLKENKGGYAKYENSCGDPCLIGSYFTPEQRQWIIKEDINSECIYQAVKVIGEHNLKAMTGMSTDQCSVLQNHFDCKNVPELIECIQDVLLGKRVSIEGTYFIL